MDVMGDQELIPLCDIDYDVYRNTCTPVLIDWGAYRSRVGFADRSEPQLVFRSLISKQRSKKDSHVLVGNDIVDIEAVKRVLRSPFELDVVTQFDSMETIFDYIFANLAIDTNRVNHPIVLNEAFCVPLWTRTNTQELLFECYDIPSLLLGVDSLFSLYHNLPDISNCLVICLGHYTCHIIPVIDGTVASEHSTRINLGGLNLSLYLQRLMQLKYPKLTQEFSFTKCEQMVQKFCHFSSDYHSESSQWSHELYYNQNVKLFKATKTVATDGSQPLVSENFVQRTQRLLKKVKTNVHKKREKQLIEWEENRNKFKALLELVEDEEMADPALVAKAYQNAGVRNLSELKSKLNELNVEIKRIKIQLNPKSVPEMTVIDEINEWQNQNTYDELQWTSYVRQLRTNKIGENAWILNELLREFELESKRLKRVGVGDNVIEFGPELIRVPELLFSPNALIQYSQCGISEAIEAVIKQLDNPEISQTIFLTGGCAHIDGIAERIEKDVTSIRPFGSPLSVIKAQDVSLDSWKGAKDSSQRFADKFVTKEEYYEFGPGFVKEFKCSNRYNL
ncbi:unnamed protein product [Medioppia subpectinata]|uniref:Actin-related protein 5 n=1 Tax=Medioppia subpectinata TaxID=1979941 RepID=A0A7R9L7Q8_9ACAR|nr:unnamed protein product [Medioppia subpectinata]CAG2116042.1 unnamed protein product [Medioppia subpectinata]